MSTAFADWHAINALMVTYADYVDRGQYAEVGALFAHGTYKIEHADSDEVSTFTGADEVTAFCAQTKVQFDGTPRSRHCVTNVDIQVDPDDADSATARSYATVLQQTPTLPLQPVATGRYLDRFERVDGQWRFAERVVTGFLLGNRAEHVEWHDSTPAAAG